MTLWLSSLTFAPRQIFQVGAARKGSLVLNYIPVKALNLSTSQAKGSLPRRWDTFKLHISEII